MRHGNHSNEVEPVAAVKSAGICVELFVPDSDRGSIGQARPRRHADVIK